MTIKQKAKTASDIIRLVADRHHLTTDELLGKSRAKEIVEARHITMSMLKKRAGMTFDQIGETFGGRHRTAVAHGIKQATMKRK